MCGLAGIVNFSRKKLLTQEIDRSLLSIKHRGPDGNGIWINDKKNIALLHSRLSILDLSNNASQPFRSFCGRYIIIFNGEIYNYKILKNRYLNDEDFKSNSDTEVILKLYIKYKEKFLDWLEGMFSFCIYDTKLNKFFFARDVFGIKPLYYYIAKNRLIFSSEIKTFFQLNVSKKINNKSISSFLTSEYYENIEETYFENIKKLKPGNYMEITNGKIKMKKFFDFFNHKKKIYIPKKDIDKKKYLFDLVSNSIETGMISDVPITIAASGGLDSSILQYEACKKNQNIELVSWDFKDNTFSERAYVEEICRITKAKSNFYEIKVQEVFKNIEKLVLINEEPFAGVPIIIYYLMLKNINKNKVILDGSGLDEAHGGYDKYQIKTSDYYKIAQDGTKSSINIAKQDFLKKNSNYDTDILQNRTFKKKLYNDLFYIKLPRALRFRDKISMSLGFELRPVFLNKELITYLHKLNHNYHFKDSLGKYFLRNSYKNKIGKKIAFSNKRNIQTPQSKWFKESLQKEIKSLIKKSHIWDLNIIDKKKFEFYYLNFLKNDIKNSFFIWQFINLHFFTKN